MCCYLNATLYALAATSAFANSVLSMTLTSVSTSAAAAGTEQQPPPSKCVLAQIQTMMRAMFRVEDRPVSAIHILSSLPWIRKVVKMSQSRKAAKVASAASASTSSESSAVPSQSSPSNSGKEEMAAEVAVIAPDECACSAKCRSVHVPDGGQQDMGEFFTHFVNVLEKTCGEHTVPNMSSMFSFRTEVTISCIQCQDAARTAKEKDLLGRQTQDQHINFGGIIKFANMSVSDMLRDTFVNAEVLEDDVYCSNTYVSPDTGAHVHPPNTKQRSRKTSRLLSRPPVFVVIPNRLNHEGKDKVTKINTRISVDLELSLEEFVNNGDDDSETGSFFPSSSSSGTYTAYCIVVHTGTAVTSGHYFCFVLPPFATEWLCCNDSKISKVKDIVRAIDMLPVGDVVFAVFYQQRAQSRYSLAHLQGLIPASFEAPRPFTAAPHIPAAAAAVAATPAPHVPLYGLDPLLREKECAVNGLVCFRMALIIDALQADFRWSKAAKSILEPRLTAIALAKTAWRYEYLTAPIKKSQLDTFHSIAKQVVLNIREVLASRSLWWENISDFLSGSTVKLPFDLVLYLTTEKMPIAASSRTKGLEDTATTERTSLLPRWINEWKCDYHKRAHGVDENLFMPYLPTVYASYASEVLQQRRAPVVIAEKQTQEPAKKKKITRAADSDLLLNWRDVFADLTEDNQSEYDKQYPPKSKTGKEEVKAPPSMMTREYLYHVIRPVHKKFKCCVCRMRVYKSVEVNRVDSSTLLTQDMVSAIYDDVALKGEDVYSLARSLRIIAAMVKLYQDRYVAYLCKACVNALRKKSWPPHLVILHAYAYMRISTSTHP